MTGSEISERLQRGGVRPTAQRIAIYNWLWEHRVHPVADTIGKALAELYPTLSRTTVYSTLKLFADAGLVTPLTIEEGELRYDVNVEFHAHFKCRVCGGVFDLELPAATIPRRVDQFLVERVLLDYYGVCPKCAAEKNEVK